MAIRDAATQRQHRTSRKKAQHWQGICYYKKTFTVPASNKHIELLFEAAMHEAKVYFNGELLQTHLGGYLPFTINLTGKVKFNQSNTIVVQLDNRDNPLIPPGKPLPKLDFNYYSGIYRNAWLITKNKMHITDVLAVTQDVTPQSATLFIKASVPVRATLKDKTGKVVASSGTQTLTVPSPQRWSPDHPYLYQLTVELIHNNKTIDQQTIPIGIKKSASKTIPFISTIKKHPSSAPTATRIIPISAMRFQTMPNTAMPGK